MVRPTLPKRRQRGHQPLQRTVAVATAFVTALAIGAGCHRPRPPQHRAPAAKAADAAGAAAAPAQALTPTAVPAASSGERCLSELQIRALELETAVVNLGVAANPIVLSGRIAFDDLQVAHVMPPVNGEITAVLVQPGEHVRRGTALAHIASPDLGQVVADVESSHADLLAAERDLTRTKALYADRAVAKKDLEATERRFVEAEAEHRRTVDKATLLGGSAAASGDTYVLRAPIDGNVLVRSATVGSEVQGQYKNGAAAPELFTLGSLETVWALADAFALDVPRLHVGEKVVVRVVAYPQEEFAGTIDWIAPGIDAESRATRVRCRLDNRQHRLKPEMLASLEVCVAGRSGVVVPIAAVFYLHGKHYVYVRLPAPCANGRARFVQREITVQDDAAGTHMAVLTGLAGGEEVVTRGGMLLFSGD